MKTILPQTVYLPGNHFLEFETEGLSSGNYTVKFIGRDGVLSQKLVVLD